MSTHVLLRLRSLGERLGPFFLPIAVPLTRLVFGQGFFMTGLAHLKNLESFKANFEKWGIPAPTLQAPMIGCLELVCGVLLVFGAFTRGAALLLLCTMVVALMTADRQSLFDALAFGDGLTNVTPLPFVVPLVWILAMGAGRLSVDYWLAQRLRRASAAPAPLEPLA